MGTSKPLVNPYKPGAGHSPPHLAGREKEIAQFGKLLEQDEITKNVILTGLRGVGKTVLMDDKYKPLALKNGWAWVGSDFSESSFLSEQHVCTRIMTDLSVYSSGLTYERNTRGAPMGFHLSVPDGETLSYEVLGDIFDGTAGLSADKLKAVIQTVWDAANLKGAKGIVFAYDEAQVVGDRKDKDEFPLAVLLETFQSIQRKGAKCMLLLTGLPTLFPRLIESRTYAERMFEIHEIGRLDSPSSRKAITVPLERNPWHFTDESVTNIIATADGYPYFIQFICRQAFDFKQANQEELVIPIDPIVRQLDSNFFGGRWETLTERQRDILYCIAHLTTAEGEFSVGEIAEVSKTIDAVKYFTPNDVSQLLPRLVDKGLIYKNRVGKYCFAVPLFGRFIMRTFKRRNERATHQPKLFE